MVFKDISNSIIQNSSSDESVQLASMTDRFLSFVLDFFILSPVVGLFVSGLLRKLRTYAILDKESPEAEIFWILFIIANIFLVILFKTLFLYFYQATPGQRFLQLKVISFPPHDHKLKFGQALLRSFLFVFGCMMFGFPFMEVLSNPLRRALHEKGSDTMTVSLKRESNSYQVPKELSELVSSWMVLLWVTITILGGIYYLRVYNKTESGYYSKHLLYQNSFLCQEIDVEESKSRVDRAMALYISGDIDDECLINESDFALWERSSKDKKFAYLIKAILADDENIKSQYFEKACSQDSFNPSDECILARFYKASKTEREKFDFEHVKLSSITGKLIKLDHTLKKKNYAQALEQIKNLRSEKYLEKFLETKYVSSVWQINDIENKSASKTNRMPASEDFSKIITEFKKKYGVQ